MIAQHLLAALAVALPVFARPEPDLWFRAISLANDTRVCGLSDEAPFVKAPKANPWAPISPEDVKAVWAFVHAPEQGLNLTNPTNATMTDNYVFWIDTLRKNTGLATPNERPLTDMARRHQQVVSLAVHRWH